jgi:hypothetical protein
MEEQIPWTGGLGNREILMDTLRGVVVWLAISFCLAMAFRWAISITNLLSPKFQAPFCGTLAGIIGGKIARWCRA